MAWPAPGLALSNQADGGSLVVVVVVAPTVGWQFSPRPRGSLCSATGGSFPPDLFWLTWGFLGHASPWWDPIVGLIAVPCAAGPRALVSNLEMGQHWQVSATGLLNVLLIMLIMLLNVFM